MQFNKTSLKAIFNSDDTFKELAIEGIGSSEDHEILADGTSLYTIYEKYPDTLIECPHNFRWEQADTPVLEDIEDSDPVEKRAVYELTFFEKEGDSLIEAQEVTMGQLREERTKLLGETDYATLKAFEGSTTVSSDMATYRQALRDLPSTANVFAIVWPTKPE